MHTETEDLCEPYPVVSSSKDRLIQYVMLGNRSHAEMTLIY